MLGKSNENYESFQILKNAGKLSSCVHCAYYSAFQLSMYSLTHKYGYSLGFLIGYGKDSHTIINKELRHRMIDDGCSADAFKYGRLMEQLKKERQKADYKTNVHGLKEISKIENALNSVVSMIKSKYL